MILKISNGWLINSHPYRHGNMNFSEYIKKHYDFETTAKSLVGLNKFELLKETTRTDLYKLFSKFNFTLGCEVGVQRGRNAKIMFDNIPNLKLHLVEPYKDHEANKRKWGKVIHRKFKKQAAQRFVGFPVVWHYTFSELAAYAVKDNSLDFVYIDGEHTYDYVMMDIIVWTRKVHSGGVVSGHDFEYWKPKQAKVYRAVMDYARVYGIRPIYATDNKAVPRERGDGTSSWFFVKP